MLRLLICLFAFLGLNALEVQVNFGKENNEDFSVLNLKHTQAFECLQHEDIHGNITSITCTIPQTPINNFVPTNTAFFALSNKVENDKLIITIVPKHKARLFATFLDLKTQRWIPKERPKKSKQWQVIGFVSKIPFLSDKKTEGLNFPIMIPSNKDLYIGQLDINLNPLQYEKGLDFNQLEEIKKFYNDQEYAKAESSASSALKAYPESVFNRDFLLYKIKADSQLITTENADSLISSALEWIKQSPADKNTPEVLYLLANAYLYNKADQEAYYYYKRIISEYPESDWDALSKMQLAINFASHSQFKINPHLFSEAYKQAKTQKVKNRILLAWARSLLSEGQQKEAEELIKTVFNQDKQHFALYPNESFSLIEDLIAHNSYDLASQVALSLLKAFPKDDAKAEKLAFNLGEWYERSNNTKEAHFYNQQFLKNYPNSTMKDLVALRDDQLLFKTGDNLKEDEKIAFYDSVIQKYPDTDISKEAYLKKAQALFNLQKFQDVLNIQPFIPESPLIAQAKRELILKSLQENQCKQIPQYLKDSDLQHLAEKDKLSLFDCLYSISYYQDAKNLIQNVDKENALDRLPWIYRLSKVFNALGQFTDSRKLGEDVLNLAQSSKQNQYYDIAFTVFDDLAQLKFTAQAKKLSTFLDEHFKEDQRMLEVWYFLLKDAQSRGDQNAIQIYSNEIINLQKKVKFFDYTPSVDFILIYSLMKDKQHDKAKKYLDELLKHKMQPQELQQAFYLQGTLLKSMGENFKPSFEQCLKIEQKSSWKNLCEKSLQN